MFDLFQAFILVFWLIVGLTIENKICRMYLVLLCLISQQTSLV